MNKWLKISISLTVAILILGFFVAIFLSPSECTYTAFCRCNNTGFNISNFSGNLEKDFEFSKPGNDPEIKILEKKTCDNLIGCKDYIFTIGLFNIYSNDKGKEVVICREGTASKFSRKIDYWSGGLKAEFLKFPKFRFFKKDEMNRKL